tara:strand:- start:712 stop:861 length:150 start_codon:yes stop_codon:yes gene_type:complete
VAVKTFTQEAEVLAVVAQGVWWMLKQLLPLLLVKLLLLELVVLVQLQMA